MVLLLRHIINIANSNYIHVYYYIIYTCLYRLFCIRRYYHFKSVVFFSSIKIMEIPFVTHPSQRYVKNDPADSSARLP